jgi:hypothetical protein
MRVVAERDVWLHAAPGRAFEVSLSPKHSEWRITLTEGGHEVATGSGDTWVVALDTALRAARGDGGS